MINQFLDLVNRSAQLCGWQRNALSSVCVRSGLFDRGLSRPTWWNKERLATAGVRFDVFRVDTGDSVRAMSQLLGYADIIDEAQLPWATAAWRLISDTGCYGWWKCVTRGAGPMAPPISGLSRTNGLPCESWGVWIWSGDTWQRSDARLQVAGSLLCLISLACLVIVCFLNDCLWRSVSDLWSGLLQPRGLDFHRHCTVSVYVNWKRHGMCWSLL